MAGKATYTDAKKAEVYVVLAANDQNVKRTARETGVPENTVRRWRDVWKTEGPPRIEEVQKAVGDFIEDSERVRNKALMEIERQIDAQELKGAALVTAYGVITDKIDRAKGLATGKIEHVHTLPSAEEARELMRGFFEGGRQMAAEREQEIIEAEVVEQPALPAGR